MAAALNEAVDDSAYPKLTCIFDLWQEGSYYLGTHQVSLYSVTSFYPSPYNDSSISSQAPILTSIAML